MHNGSAVSLLAALMNCIPGLNTAKLKELLLKLQIPAVEEVPGLTMSEAVNLLIPWYIALLYNSIALLYDSAI